MAEPPTDADLARTDLPRLVADLRALREATSLVLVALRHIPDVRWRQALDGQLPDGFVLTTIYEVNANGVNSRSFTAADLRRLAALVEAK